MLTAATPLYGTPPRRVLERIADHPINEAVRNSLPVGSIRPKTEDSKQQGQAAKKCGYCN